MFTKKLAVGIFALATTALAPVAFADDSPTTPSTPTDRDHGMNPATTGKDDTAHDTTAPDTYKDDTSTTDHDRLTVDQLPVAVKTTVQKETNGKSVDTIRKDTMNGQTVYKVDYTDNKGMSKTLTVSAAGKVVDRGSTNTTNGNDTRDTIRDKDANGTTSPKSTNPPPTVRP